jgi:hypothetical protein
MITNFTPEQERLLKKIEEWCDKHYVDNTHFHEFKNISTKSPDYINKLFFNFKETPIVALQYKHELHDLNTLVLAYCNTIAPIKHTKYVTQIQVKNNTQKCCITF